MFIKANKTTIVVTSAHARCISAMPVLLLGWVFACYGPSTFYLAVVHGKRDRLQYKKSLGRIFGAATPPRGASFIRANPRTKVFERGRRACAPCQSQAFFETSSQHLSGQKPIRSYNIWLLKRISARNYQFRSCVITLRSMIRVRYV